MKNLFGFMDETGVLSSDPLQKFFALGLLKLESTSCLFEEVKKLKDRHHKKGTNFEFKFTNIKKDSDLSIHQELIDICLGMSDFYFSSIVLDKNKLVLEPDSTWDLQIKLAKKHIKNAVKRDEQIVVIADYLSKPNGSVYFEDELNRSRKVFNACMLESHSSVFIQIVDILIGCVVYSYKMKDGLVSTATPKAQLVGYLESKLNILLNSHNNSSGKFKHTKKISNAFTIFKPIYFAVYEKRK